MKKTLLLLASMALLLVGCQKENFVEQQDGKLVDATFTASLESGVATRAAVDGDGAAASVNRCIMEIYYGDELFARQIKKVTNKQATFTVQVVSNRKYTVAFWADKVDDASTEAGRAIDKYYTTNATGGLQSISIKKITDEQLYIGNDDARDAFYHVGEYTVAQAGSSWGEIKLYRPFAQMNVITTDWNVVTTVDALKPEKVNVTLKNALVNFNAVTGEASGSQTLTYTADVYAPAASGTNSEIKTLSMDYLFASKDKAVIDIDWKALHGTDANVKHSFAAVPYQRNYRTNIKGALLTTQGQWTVTVEPQWAATEYDVPFLSASTITEAQNYIGTGGSETSKKVVDLSKATIKTTDLVGSEGDKKIEFKLMTTSPADMVSFTLPAIPTEVTDAGCTGWKITYEPNYPTKNVNVTAPTGTNVVIEAPTSHVTLNGVSYGQVTATTGASTLVVPAGVTVKNLTVKKGAVEIHGTVEALTVTPDEDAKVVFRACEGLSAAVFEKIYKQGVCNYIDPMYAYKQVGENYDIYKLPVVAMIGDVEYPSLAAAINAVKDNDIIVLTKDVENAEGLKVNTEKTFTVDFNGHTYTLNKPGAGSAGTEANAFQLLQGQKVTFKNGKIEVSPDNLTPATVGKNIKRLIQGYAELVLEDMVLDATNLYESNAQYVCSFNNQPVTLKGNTSIIGLREGFTAFDSDGNWDGYARCQVTIDTKGTIAGPIELGQGYIEINDVVLLGAINLCTSCGASETEGQLDRITIKGGTFSVDPSAYVKVPYEVKENSDGTFSVVKSPTVVTDQEGFNKAVSSAVSGDIIKIANPGTYEVPNINANVTIKGVEGVKFNCEGTGSIASIPNGATFKNVEMKFGKSSYHGFQHSGRIIMEGCTLEGLFFGYGDMVFNDCTFKQPQSEYLMWTYGSEYLEFNNCKFDVAGKALNVYQENSPMDHVIIINNCEFKSSTANKPALAIKNNGNNGTGTTPIYYDITITNSTFEGFGQSDGDLMGFPSDAPYVNAYGYNHSDKPLKVTVDGEVMVNIPKN